MREIISDIWYDRNFPWSTAAPKGRYIEIFKSTSDEMDYVLEKAERQANQPWDNVIRLRGIPFKVHLPLLLVN